MAIRETIKRKIMELLESDLHMKIDLIETELRKLEESRNNESKSTAGDKHEVGRAMAQSQLENFSRRLHELKEAHARLTQLDLSPSFAARAGSLISTSATNYFLSSGHGKVEVNGQEVFAISPTSPIGQMLLGKKKGDVICFQNQEVSIHDIF